MREPIIEKIGGTLDTTIFSAKSIILSLVRNEFIPELVYSYKGIKSPIEENDDVKKFLENYFVFEPPYNPQGFYSHFKVRDIKTYIRAIKDLENSFPIRTIFHYIFISCQNFSKELEPAPIQISVENLEEEISREIKRRLEIKNLNQFLVFFGSLIFKRDDFKEKVKGYYVHAMAIVKVVDLF